MLKSFLASCVLPVAILAGAAPAADRTPSTPLPDTTPAGKPRFDSSGAKVGDQLPNLPVRTLEGKPAALADAWKDGPTLLLTSSYSCPKSRSTYPSAAELARRVAGRGVRVAMIYVIEAHPAGDPSPYTRVEDLTAENRRDQIFCRQPRTMVDRLKLANAFARRMQIGIPVFVDEMDNAAWTHLGGGPNMGVLVDGEGVVLARQGWFDAKSMGGAIDAFVAAAPKKPATQPTEAEAKQQGTLTTLMTLQELDKLKVLLDGQPELEKEYPIEGDSLLQAAARWGEMKVVEFLVRRGADVNRQSPSAPSPLHLAAQRGHVEIIEFLIKHGADVNVKALGHGPTPLQDALIQNHPEAVGVLLANGAKPNFYTAAATGDAELIRKAYLADMTILQRPDGQGYNALIYATAAKNLESVKLLLSLGAKDLPGNPGRYQAAWWAVYKKDLNITRVLLDAGSNPNLLYLAIDDKRPIDFVQIMLDHGATPNSTDSIGPLHLAAGYGREDIVQLLLTKGADVNAPVVESNGLFCGPTYFQGDTPLHIAIHNHRYPVAELLMSRGAKPDAKNGSKDTPLHLAMTGLHDPWHCEDARALVAKLIGLGADVNAKNGDGQTPLDLAVPREHDIFKRDEEAVKKRNDALAEAVSLLKKVGAVNGKPRTEK